MRTVKLVAKIGGGFGSIILLLLIVAFFAWRGLTVMASGIREYDRKASNFNRVTTLKETMLTVRMKVKDYFINHDSKDLEIYETNIKKLREAIDDGKSNIKNASRSSNMQKISDFTDAYVQAFERIVVDIGESDRIVNEVLRTLGPSMQKKCNEMADAAQNDRDFETLAKINRATQHIILGRLYAQRFFATVAEKDAALVVEENVQLQEILTHLVTVLPPGRRAIAQQILGEAQGYVKGFNQMAKASVDRQAAYNETLVRIGSEISILVDEIRQSHIEDQQKTGTFLVETGYRSLRTTELLTLAASFLALGFPYLLTKAITQPVLKTAAFAAVMAQGDFTSKLEIHQQDEIGEMAHSLNSMVDQLGNTIREIIKGVTNLSGSSTDLASISRQLSASAKDAANKSDSVAGFADVMNTNFQSVSVAMEQSTGNVNMIATATDEMTQTINEIAHSAEKARMITGGAVRQSQETSTKMVDLGESARKIGRVTETITEISEQTNLLALNATIEAARAGEAGKGFAVVANEIKELARQTADATVDIRNQINAMQATTAVTIEDIQNISSVIDEINTVINAIASAVEEQSTATSEIAGSIAQTSEGIADVNGNVARSSVVAGDINQKITEVNFAVDEIASSSARVNSSAHELQELADHLAKLVARFKVGNATV